MSIWRWRRLKTAFAAGRRWGVVVALGAVCCAPGCVHRRLTVRSDPPGALVMLEGREVGYTPVSLDFTYYGTREVTLTKDGYETLTVLQKVPMPWYQVPPLDFVSENLVPAKIDNRHDFTYRLQPQVLVGNPELLQRANGLRSESQVTP